MTVSVVQSKAGRGVGPPQTLTLDSSITAGNLLVVGAFSYNGDDLTDNAISDNLSNSYSVQTSNDRGKLWSSIISNAGTPTISIANGWGVVAFEITGQASSWADGSPASAEGEGTSVTVNLSDTTESNVLVLGIMYQWLDTTHTAGNGWTQSAYAYGGFITVSGQWILAETSGSYDPNATFGESNQYIGFGIAIKSEPAAGQPVGKRFGGIPFASQNSQSSYRW